MCSHIRHNEIETRCSLSDHHSFLKVYEVFQELQKQYTEYEGKNTTPKILFSLYNALTALLAKLMAWGSVFHKSHYFKKRGTVWHIACVVICRYECKKRRKRRYQNKCGGNIIVPDIYALCFMIESVWKFSVYRT